MALISTVEPHSVYAIQLVGFSAFAVARIIAGAGGLLRRVWVARWMKVLAWVGAVYFVGVATTFFVSMTARDGFHLLYLFSVLALAAPSILFLLMARSLSHVAEVLTAEKENA